jgi:hypothetical protein
MSGDEEPAQDALPRVRRDMAPHAKLVGTRSCAIRRRTSEEGEHLVKLMGKSLSSESARARSQKQQKEAWRHAAPDARERIYRGRRTCSVLSEICTEDLKGMDLICRY